MNAKAATCPPASILSDFGLGKLDDRLAETLNEHLETCADCRRVVDRMAGDSFVDRMRAAVNPAKQPADPEGTMLFGAESVSNVASSSETPTTDGSASGQRELAGPSSAADPSGLTLPPALAESPDFEIIKALGQGGMGVVYLARNRMMDRLEVLKVVSKSLLDRPGALERFQQEIRSAAKLLHPNIVAAHSVPRLGDLLVFAMEYVDGQDLSQVVKRRGPLPVTNATYYAQQVALGLQHAHEKGMVHRDIKPSNLMLAVEGKKHVVKILDFGLAKATSEKLGDHGLTKTGQMLGTPDYIAPEQTLDAQKADIRADIYSLGCTLYYLLSGHPPFQGQSLYEILQAHHQTAARPLNLVRADVPVELATIVSKMMAKKPEDRFQTPGEVAKALGPFFKAPAPAGVTAELPPPASSAILPSPLAGAGPGVRGVPVRAAPIPVAADPLAGIEAAPGRPRKKTTPGRHKLLVPVAIGLLLAGFLAAAALIYKFKTADGIVVVKVNVANPDVLVDGNRMTVTWADGGKQAEIRLPPGSRKLELQKDGFKAFGETVSLADGGQELLTATLEPLTPSSGPNHSAIQNSPAFNQWIKSVAALPAEKQVEAVAKKLIELNPDFDGNVTDYMRKGPPKIENNVVTEFGFTTDDVSDISPVRAMAGLKVLQCSGSRKGTGKLSDLSALKGMKLRTLDCGKTQISNLSPLQGMPLTTLSCGFSPVSDLSPLQGMQLVFLWCPVTPVSDLSPLKGMPLETLNLGENARMSDLQPLEGMPLRTLWCNDSQVSDLTPLTKVPTLETLHAERTRVNPAVVIALQQALPNCKIEWNGSATPNAPLAISSKSEANYQWPAGTPAPAIAPFGAKQARAHQEAWANYIGVPVEQTNSIGMKLVLIPPGEFMMGSTPEQNALNVNTAEHSGIGSWGLLRLGAEAPQHRVTLTNAYLLGATEVTIGQFKTFVEATGHVTQAEQLGFGNSDFTASNEKTPRQQKGMTWRSPGYATSGESPATQVTWSDAVQFCNWLSSQEKLNTCYQRDANEGWIPSMSGTGYRLPTEAEWECACRAGTATQFSFGDDPATLDSRAWFMANSGDMAHMVGSKPPNAFGLYDMHGNVDEYCDDWFSDDYYGRPSQVNPSGPRSGQYRVPRGGDFRSHPIHCRSASRQHYSRIARYNWFGFRVMRTALPVPISLSPTIATEPAAKAVDEPGSKPDPIGAKLAKAKETYENKTHSLRDVVTKALDRKETTTRANGDKKAVDQIKAEREAFETSGKLPTLVPTGDYARQLQGARTQLEAAYEAAIKVYTKAGLDEQISAVEAELAKFRQQSAP